jgi:sec-independent protein translocase protein TatA
VFGNLGAGEILLIVVFILIFFGPRKIPEIAQGLGKGIREFRKATREIQDVVEKEVSEVKEVGQIKEVREIKEIAQTIEQVPKTSDHS